MKGCILMVTYLKEWAKAAGIRAIKTVCQTALATIGTSAAVIGFEDVNWRLVISASLLAGVLSLITSIAGLPEIIMPEASEDVGEIGDEDSFDYIEPPEEEENV